MRRIARPFAAAALMLATASAALAQNTYRQATPIDSGPVRMIFT